MEKAEAKPWQMMPDESAKSYGRFMYFLHQGTNRTLQQVATMEGISHAAIQKQAQKHKWDERAKAYDLAFYEDVQHTAKELNAKHLAGASEAFDRCMEIVRKIDPNEKHSLSGIASFLSTVIKAGRDASGIPDINLMGLGDQKVEFVFPSKEEMDAQMNRIMRLQEEMGIDDF